MKFFVLIKIIMGKYGFARNAARYAGGVGMLAASGGILRSKNKSNSKSSRVTKQVTKKKYNAGGSRVRPRRKKKKSSIVHSPATGQSNSALTIKFKPIKLNKQFNTMHPPFTFDQIDGFGCFSEIGLQKPQTIFVSGMGGNSASTSPIAVQINYLANKAGATLTTAGAVNTGAVTVISGQRSNKVLLNSSSNILEFTNQGPATCNVTLYNLMCKSSAETFQYPETVWAQGLSDQTGIDGNSNLTPWTGPTTSKRFNMNWKVMKKTVIELGPGRGHIHTFKHIINRPIDTEYAYQFLQIKGVTTCVMMVVQGYPGDSVKDYNSVVTPTIGPSKVVGITRQQWIVRNIVAATRHTQHLNNLPPAPSDVFTFEEGLGAVLDMADDANYA